MYTQLFRTLNLQYDSDFCYNSDFDIGHVCSACRDMSTKAWEYVIRSVDLCNLKKKTYFVHKASRRSVAVTLCLAFFAALSSHSSSSWRRATTPSWSNRLVRLSAPCFNLYACCILSLSSAASDASSSFRKEHSNSLLTCTGLLRNRKYSFNPSDCLKHSKMLVVAYDHYLVTWWSCIWGLSDFRHL